MASWAWSALGGAMAALMALPAFATGVVAWSIDVDDGPNVTHMKWCGKSQVNVWDATGGPYPGPNGWAIASFYSLPIRTQVTPYGTPSNHDVKIVTYNRATHESAEVSLIPWGRDAAGHYCLVSYPVPPGCTCSEAVTIRLNTFWMWDDQGDKIEAITAHEIGHAMGLGHESRLGHMPLMYPNQDYFTYGKVILPIYDDIMGLDYYYGPRNSQLASTSGYYVSRDGSNTPVREWIGSSANGRYAHAYEEFGRSNSWRGTGMVVWVTPNTLHRFSLGIGTNVDPHDTNSRVVSLEVRSDGIRAQVANRQGGYTTYAFSTAASVGTQYFLQVWWKPSDYPVGESELYMYAYKPGTHERIGAFTVGAVDMKYATTTGYFLRGVSVRSNAGDPAGDYSIAKVYGNHFNM